MQSVSFMPPLSAMSERQRKKHEAAREARLNERKGRIYSPFWESPVRVPCFPSTSFSVPPSSSYASLSVSQVSSVRHAERPPPAAQATGRGPSEYPCTGRALAGSRSGPSLDIPRCVPKPARDNSGDVSVIGELDQRRQSLETEIGLLSARKRQLEEDTSLLSADLATLSQGLFSLRQEHNTARASLETKQQTLERAERDLTEAAAATAQEHERFSKAREAAENLHRDFQRKESEAHRQLQDLEAQIETARRSNAASARSAGKKIQDDTAKAQTDLSKAKDDTAHAQAELEKILADTRSARADFRQAQGEVKTAAAERDHLADGLKRARQSVAQAEAAARDAQAKASAEQDKLALVQRDVSQAQAQAIAADGRAAIARRTAETEEVRAQQANKQADEEERRVLSAQDALRRALEGSKSSTTTAPVIPASSGMSGLAQLISPARASTENDLSSSPSSLPPAAAATGGTGPNKRNSGASTKFQKVSPLFGWDDDLDAQADLAPTTPATVVPARPYQPLESLDAPTPAVIAEPRSESQTSTQATAVNNAAHAAMSDVTTTKLGTSESAKEPDPSGASSSVIPRHGEHHVSNPRALSASSPQFGRGMAPVSIGRNASHFGREPPPLPSLADAWRERELRQHAPVTSPPARKESQGAGTAAFNMMKSVLGFRSSSTPENAASQSQLAPETLAWAQQPWSQDTSPLQQRDQNGSPVGFYVPGALDAPQFKHDPWKAPPKDAKLVDVDSETGYDIQDDGEQAAEVTITPAAPALPAIKTEQTENAATSASATDKQDATSTPASEDVPLTTLVKPLVPDSTVPTASERAEKQEPPKLPAKDPATKSTGTHAPAPIFSSADAPAPTPILTSANAPAPAPTSQTASAFENVVLELKPADQVKWRLAVLEVIQPLVYAMPAGGDEYSAQDVEAM